MLLLNLNIRIQGTVKLNCFISFSLSLSIQDSRMEELENAWMRKKKTRKNLYFEFFDVLFIQNEGNWVAEKKRNKKADLEEKKFANVLKLQYI